MAEDSETFWCEVCNEERPADASFCPKCGAKLTVRTPVAEPEEPALPAQVVVAPAPPKRLSRKQLVVAASLVASLVLAGGTYGVVSAIQQQREERIAAEAAEAAAEAAAEKRRVEAETLVDAFGTGPVANSLPSCEQIAGLVSADEERWEAAVSVFDGVGDPREASRILATVRSANGTLEDADVEAYSESFKGGVIDFLEALFASSPRDEQTPAAQIGRWETEWVSLARDSCPAEFEAFDSTYASLQASAAKFSRISTLAGQVPWYPEGYQELLPGIAFQWVDTRADCYNCYQWDADFVSERTCNSVYAEVDILDSSGRVIGWTNDTLRSVRAGEVGRLTFQTYRGSGILTARFSEFNCR